MEEEAEDSFLNYVGLILNKIMASLSTPARKENCLILGPGDDVFRLPKKH